MHYFSSVSGLTQQSEMGILAAMFCLLLLTLATVAVIAAYTTRSWSRKGVYHTGETPNESATNVSNTSSLLVYPDAPPPPSDIHAYLLPPPKPELLI
jgi:hypothetical protein